MMNEGPDLRPALSQQIRALEELVGAKLFERTTRRVMLTRVGLLFLPEAQETIAMADRALLRARQAARGEVGGLRLGFVSAASLGVLPESLADA